MTLIVTVTLPMVASAAREWSQGVRVRELILGHKVSRDLGVKTWELLEVER